MKKYLPELKNEKNDIGINTNKEFLHKFLQVTTTFSNEELHADRSSEQSWRTFDNKFLAIGAVLKDKIILSKWIWESFESYYNNRV